LTNTKEILSTLHLIRAAFASALLSKEELIAGQAILFIKTSNQASCPPDRMLSATEQIINFFN
jgi:hypothetical protein